MKYRTTRRHLRGAYSPKNCLAVGYCDAWYLLRWTEPDAYTAGVYGWNFDAYDIDGYLITTGYRGMIGKQTRFVRQYEEKAKKIFESVSKTFTADGYAKKMKKIKKLCLDWINKEFEGV